MFDTIRALLNSRKWWVGSLTILATFGVLALRALDKIPADAMGMTMATLTTIGLGVIGSIAWEDTTAKKADATRAAPAPAPAAETNVTVNTAKQDEPPVES